MVCNSTPNARWHPRLPYPCTIMPERHSILRQVQKVHLFLDLDRTIVRRSVVPFFHGDVESGLSDVILVFRILFVRFPKIRFAVEKHRLVSASRRFSSFSPVSRLSLSGYHRSEKSAIRSSVRLISYAMSPADWQMACSTLSPFESAESMRLPDIKGHLPSGNAGYVLLRSGRSCFPRT